MLLHFELDDLGFVETGVLAIAIMSADSNDESNGRIKWFCVDMSAFIKNELEKVGIPQEQQIQVHELLAKAYNNYILIVSNSAATPWNQKSQLSH